MVVVPTARVSSGQWSRYLHAAADLRAHVNRAVCGYHNRRLSNSERAALTGAGNDYQLREAFWGKRRHTTSGQHRSEKKVYNSFLDMFMARQLAWDAQRPGESADYGNIGRGDRQLLEDLTFWTSTVEPLCAGNQYCPAPSPTEIELSQILILHCQIRSDRSTFSCVNPQNKTAHYTRHDRSRQNLAFTTVASQGVPLPVASAMSAATLELGGTLDNTYVCLSCIDRRLKFA
jgi:hypothetical protein